MSVRCFEDGYLVGMNQPLPAAPTEHYVEGGPFVGCNHVACDRCHEVVRHIDSRMFAKPLAPAERRLALRQLGRCIAARHRRRWWRQLSTVSVQMHLRRHRRCELPRDRRPTLALRRPPRIDEGARIEPRVNACARRGLLIDVGVHRRRSRKTHTRSGQERYQSLRVQICAAVTARNWLGKSALAEQSEVGRM